MKITPAKDDSKAPRTRRELLSHLWSQPDLMRTNVFKEGPFYAAQNGSVIAATHSRTIDSRTFAEWAQFMRAIPQGVLM